MLSPFKEALARNNEAGERVVVAGYRRAEALSRLKLLLELGSAAETRDAFDILAQRERERVQAEIDFWNTTTALVDAWGKHRQAMTEGAAL